MHNIKKILSTSMGMLKILSLAALRQLDMLWLDFDGAVLLLTSLPVHTNHLFYFTVFSFDGSIGSNVSIYIDALSGLHILNI